MFTKLVRPLRLLIRQIKLPLIAGTLPHSFYFSQYKATLEQELLHYASNLPQNSSQEDFTELIRNYLELSEKSFLDYVKGSNADPQLLLMLMSTFQSADKVREFLPFLYHKINYFEKKQMLSILQKILAFKPTLKPKIPYARALEQIQSVLVILGELYKSDLLVEWIKFVPLYKGEDFYIVSMGYFSILSRMSQEVKQKNRPTLIKCHKRICKELEKDTVPNQIKIGIVILAFEQNYKQSLNLLLNSDISLNAIDNKMKILFAINLTNFLASEKLLVAKKEKKQEESPVPEHVTQVLQELDNLIKDISLIENEVLLKEIQLDLYAQLWRALSNVPVLFGSFKTLSQKLAKISMDKDFERFLKLVTLEEKLSILECMAKHKMENEKFLRRLIVDFTPHLHTIDKNMFKRLLKCLVTYVRSCEDYLINTRKILEERKLQFSEADAQEINEILRRVMVLFPHAFKAGA